MQRINRILAGAPILAALAISAASAQNATPPRLAKNIAAAPARASLIFQANNGQVDRRICFLSQGQTSSLYLTRSDAMVTMAHYPMKEDPKAPGHAISAGKPVIATVRMSLLNSNARVDVHGQDPVAVDGKGASGKTFSKVHYPKVYPGIDMVLHADDRCLGYEFTVAPRANAGLIGWSVEGARKLVVNGEGELAAQTSAGDLCWDRPTAYQVIDGKRHAIPCSYVIKGHDVRFHMGTYDHSKSLIIAPAPESAE